MMTGPDGLIAPWLEVVAPRTLVVIGPTLPLVENYQSTHAVDVVQLSPDPHALTHHSMRYEAVLISQVIETEDDLVLPGIARNQLAPQVFVLIRPAVIAPSALFGLGYVRHSETHDREGPLLSFCYTLATYNHTRAWNNAKFWANPEQWNKHWW